MWWVSAYLVYAPTYKQFWFVLLLVTFTTRHVRAVVLGCLVSV